ncbi:ABC transporter substrate-binding protein [Pseudoalteromonas luteoviolacea]|uniref:ABC transporter substrate-binding protein n=1 Tax=Pseudoalteromonas luteoviolacea TaxID=43657 RepID=UPI001B3A7222|nr:ABC transporter substrate-binding protein [Pseudoalteromonas luteoviolacea]MBQ4879050.1 ABC transporter substrate-binding protein [Pseudoalteromonas luteoviolacea]MBQ4908195.1 ABC transporter substrate-binding protein [Pseudoalteromonas luteoviolacea]
MKKVLFFLLLMHCQAMAEPIRIIVNDWTSQKILANIAEQIFIRLGFEVELITVTVDEQWFLLKTNNADLQLEVWQGTMEDKFNQLHRVGKIVDLGEYSVKTREDWWYPLYVKDMCPGLPNWRALRTCADIFKRAGSRGKGVYIAGPWEKPDRARIKALGLNFIVKQVDEGKEIWQELKYAIEKRHAILVFNWTPNWVGAVYPGEFVEFPQYAKECEEDSSWGVNSELVFDCGNPRSGWLKKVSSRRFAEMFPCLSGGVKRFDLTNEEIETLSAQVDVHGRTVKQAALDWIKTNKLLWEEIFSTCEPQLN